MKKLMLALATVTAVVGVQAAQVDWKATITGQNLEGATAYVFNSTDRTAVLGLLGDFTSSSDLLAYALPFESGKSSGTGTAKETRGTVTTTFSAATAQNVKSTDNIFSIIFDGDIAVGTDYMVTADTSLSGMTYDKGAGSPGTINFTSYPTTGTIESVPEPTSGLLLLLGMAGLALKRKRV